jgi:hypothetical protein
LVLGLALVLVLVPALLVHQLPCQIVQSRLQQLVSIPHPGVQHQPSWHVSLLVVVVLQLLPMLLLIHPVVYLLGQDSTALLRRHCTRPRLTASILMVLEEDMHGMFVFLQLQ